MPVGVVERAGIRRAAVALRRPARVAARNDRTRRDRRALPPARDHRQVAGAQLPQLPPPRDAVRHDAARAPTRHVADVPGRGRGPKARPRARVGGVPRAPVRPVHEHADARRAGRHRAGTVVAAGSRRSRAAGRRRRARDRGAVRRRPRARAIRGRRPDRVPGPLGHHARGRGPLHRPEPRAHRRGRQAASRSAASSRSRPTTSRSPTSIARSSGGRLETTRPTCSPPSRTGSRPPRSPP